MNQRQIDRFFRVLARELDESATVILTGAAAAALWGHVRPSVDIDFAIRLARRGQARWRKIEEAVDRTVKLTGIQANYAEDIDRWGPITLLDYWRHTLPYRRFGRLNVCLLDPAYWSIGKISRYLDPDVHDLAAVLKHRHIPATRLVHLWARALRKSPPSMACLQFRKQGEHFLGTYGRTIWGRRFDPEQAIRHFLREAGLA